MPTFTTCTHIKVTGVRCGSAPLRGEQFCYFHQHAHRGVRKPPQSRLHPIAILEDEESIQSSLMEVINALMRNTIDLKRAELILRALHIAVKNARRVKFDIHAADTVREIPNYASVGADAFARPSGKAAVETPSEVELQTEADQPAEDELPSSASIPPARTLSAKEQRNLAKFQQEQDRQADIRARLTRAAESITGATGREAASAPNVGTAAPGCSSTATKNVGTDAFVRTGGPAVPVRSALPPQSGSVPPHNFKKDAAPTQARPADPTKRKPSVSLNAAPKERKNTAHRASGE